MKLLAPFFAIILVLGSTCEAEELAIDYPFRYTLSDSSMLLITQTGEIVCKAFSDPAEIIFTWSTTEKILRINGTQFYPEPRNAFPPVKETEKEVEAICKHNEYISKLFEETSSWIDARRQYIEEISACDDSIRAIGLRYLVKGEELRKSKNEIYDLLKKEPNRNFYVTEKEIEFGARSIKVYSQQMKSGHWPSNEITYPDDLSWCLVPQDEEAWFQIEGQKKNADSMVMEIISWFRSTPNITHVVCVSPGGPSRLFCGKSARIAYDQISHAAKEKIAIKDTSIPLEWLNTIVNKRGDQ